jgi:hypothetical protein
MRYRILSLAVVIIAALTVLSCSSNGVSEPTRDIDALYRTTVANQSPEAAIAATTLTTNSPITLDYLWLRNGTPVGSFEWRQTGDGTVRWDLIVSSGAFGWISTWDDVRSSKGRRDCGWGRQSGSIRFSCPPELFQPTLVDLSSALGQRATTITRTTTPGIDSTCYMPGNERQVCIEDATGLMVSFKTQLRGSDDVMELQLRARDSTAITSLSLPVEGSSRDLPASNLGFPVTSPWPSSE